MMEKEKILTYEGGFQGYLSAVSAGLSQELQVGGICPKEAFHADTLFGVRLHIPTNIAEARGLWNALGKTGPDTQRYIYYSYLSDKTDIHLALYTYIGLLFKKEGRFWEQKYALKEQLAPWAQRVGREKRHLEDTMRFKHAADGIPYSFIRPVCNILPLLSKYCRMRFRGGRWLVYDVHRNLRLYGNAGQIMLSRTSQRDVDRILGLRPVFSTEPLPDKAADFNADNGSGVLALTGQRQLAACGAGA